MSLILAILRSVNDFLVCGDKLLRSLLLKQQVFSAEMLVSQTMKFPSFGKTVRSYANVSHRLQRPVYLGTARPFNLI